MSEDDRVAALVERAGRVRRYFMDESGGDPVAALNHACLTLAVLVPKVPRGMVRDGRVADPETGGLVVGDPDVD